MDYFTENGKKYMVALRMEFENALLTAIDDPSDLILKKVGANGLINRILTDIQRTPAELFAEIKEEAQDEIHTS